MTKLTKLIEQRKEEMKQKRASKMLKYAKDLISNGDIKALTIRNIAKSIKYSLPVVYAHWKTKKDIIEELDEDLRATYPDYESLFVAFKKELSA
jgi:AcrR family transcriptional regulator